MSRFYFDEIGIDFTGGGIHCGLFEGYATVDRNGSVTEIELYGYRKNDRGGFDLVPGPDFAINQISNCFDDTVARFIARHIEAKCQSSITDAIIDYESSEGPEFEYRDAAE